MGLIARVRKEWFIIGILLVITCAKLAPSVGVKGVDLDMITQCFNRCGLCGNRLMGVLTVLVIFVTRCNTRI
uniref:Uncharacterized protein n=1 Tax=Cyprinus carpio TaxID=7962 RepID=A0A8C1LHC4_CYPCA